MMTLKQKLWEMYLKLEAPIWGSLIFCAFMIQWILTGNSFADGDGYQRLLRIMDFIYTGSWQEVLFKYSNYPFGEVNHWTRPMDILWILISLPLLCIHPMSLALYIGAFFISPVMAFFTVCVFIWGVKPFMTPFMRISALLLFMSNPWVEAFYHADRPDHHSVLLLLLVLCTACFLRWICRPEKRYIISAGFLCALGLWIAPEFIITFYILLSFLFVVWVFYQKKVSLLVLFTGCFTIGVIGAWLANPPMQGLFYLDNGRISFFWTLLAIFTFLSVLIIAWLSRFVTESDTRCFLSVVVALFGFLAFYGLVGESAFDFALSPYLNMIWGKRIREMRTAFSNVGLLLNIVPLFVFACVVGLRLLIRLKSAIVVLLLISMGIFFVFSLYAIRFVPFVIMSEVIIICLFAQSFLLQAKEKGEEKIPDKVMAILFTFFILSYLGMFLTAGKEVLFPSEQVSEEKKTSEIIWAYLQVGNQKKSILADTFWSPEIAWHTVRPVIGTCYHRNLEGIRDGYRLFFSDNEREIVYFIHKHRVSDIVMRGDYDEETVPFYEKPEENLDKLYAKVILNKELYPWMVPVLTDAQKAGYYLYRIDESKLPPLDEEEQAVLVARQKDVSLPDKIPEIELRLFQPKIPEPKTTFTKEDILPPSPFDKPKKSKFMKELEELVPEF